MSEYAVMPLSDYVNACNTIRGYTSGDDSDKIKSTELSPRINQIFSNGLSSGYGNGYEDGNIDGIKTGEKAMLNAMLESLQGGGRRTNYSSSFFECTTITKKNFKPI